LDASQFSGQHDTTHAGHGLIGDDQVEVLWRRLEGVQGLGAARVGHHGVAQALEHMSPQVGQHRLVIHKEQTLMAPGEWLCRTALGSGCLLGLGAR
jgi:hypothetical protein